MQQRLELEISGRVQGVGFRPFVYRLATRLQLYGWVRNEKGRVRIQVQGDPSQLEKFCSRLVEQAPITALPVIHSSRAIKPVEESRFIIQPSQSPGEAEIHVPPDYFLCPDCELELNDPADRRYRYPFINCTACGPRYTVIHTLPYDRNNTSMREFALCPECQSDYEAPDDRRFHAEPLACPRCGPQLQYQNPASEQPLYADDALQACVSALEQGRIVTIKGIGGYHLCCDATNAQAIARLRQRKQRPDKPLAVLFPATGDDGLHSVRQQLQVDSIAAEALSSPARPIVLLPRRPDCRLPRELAPGLEELGVMLPYSPLHHLLLEQLGRPIVATSANLRGEPVLIDGEQVKQRLGHISDDFLHHDRPILRPADDPVVRIIANHPRPFRLGRGTAPLELTLPHSVPQPLLACGGQMKNTIALAQGQRVILSPHIGDLDAPRSRQVYTGVITDLQRLYAIQPRALICDTHPDYYSSRWARQQSLPVYPVDHHHAHAAILAGEFPHEDNWLVFTWDGVGLGPDQTLWGGEALYGRPGQWQRQASWRPFHLPGGERAAREPWRSALALCWETKTPWEEAPAETSLLYEAWQKRLNTPTTTAVGRLFDAAAALVGLCREASFEGQGPMQLEQLAGQAEHDGIDLPLYEDAGLWRSDWTPLIALLQNRQLSQAARATAFHHSLARALLSQARQIQKEQGEFAIGLSGGVFQNRLLVELIMQQCQQAGYRVYLPQQVPVNDAGLCYGQIIEARARYGTQLDAS